MGTGGIVQLFLNFDTRYRWMVIIFVASVKVNFFYILLHAFSHVSCLLCVLVITVLHTVCSENTLFL